MPTSLIVIIAKVLLRTSRLLGRGGGSALPGLVAERLDPNIGRKLARRIPHGSIVVTGTNGKTTTSKMLAQILDDSGEQLVQNRAGSNLSRGVVSALIEHVGWNGRFNETMGLFEVDEAAMPAVCRMLQPREIAVLNLFRDQLDRYGELDTTATLIGKGIAGTKAVLHLNADDPLVASLSKYAPQPDKVHYFGVNQVEAGMLSHDITADSNTCPVCGRALDYSQTFYGHIGHYSCPEGHFERPQPGTTAADIELHEDSTEFKLESGDDAAWTKLKLPGLYNIYNAVAAASVASQLGIGLESLTHSLQKVHSAFGRVEKVTIGNKQLYLLLVKNPTGFNQIIQTFLLNKKQQHLLIVINDNFADGRDVSWLWDVSFEDLRQQHHVIDVGGQRATDMALRLKYTNILSRDVSRDIKKSLNQFIAQLPEHGTGYVIPTYTAMLEIRKQLGRKTKLKGVWE
jgi:UDP-N-acetylmuramyl tripeptide synthase